MRFLAEVCKLPTVQQVLKGKFDILSKIIFSMHVISGTLTLFMVRYDRAGKNWRCDHRMPVILGDLVACR